MFRRPYSRADVIQERSCTLTLTSVCLPVLLSVVCCQEPDLFDDTLEYNVAYGNPNMIVPPTPADVPITSAKSTSEVSSEVVEAVQVHMLTILTILTASDCLVE